MTQNITTDTSSEAGYIQFGDFSKVELRVGIIISADIVEKSEKLLKLAVNFGEYETSTQMSEGENEGQESVSIPRYRQVVSGIRKQFQNPEELIGKMFVFVTNLEPRPIMGLVSEAMIIAGTSESGLALMTPTAPLAPGTRLS